MSWLELYIEYMELIRDEKVTPGFNHSEHNFYSALHDDATLTEACALVLYLLAISGPYAQVVRTEGTNALDLQPLHDNLFLFLDRLIDNPELILDADSETGYKEATLLGLPWVDKRTFDAVQKLKPRVPHLKEIFVAGLKGAAETWLRFTAEYEPSGLIDTSTSQERALVFVPATNCHNEGALGRRRLAARFKPAETTHAFSHRITTQTNDTQTFIDAMFTGEDHIDVMRLFRRFDSSGASQRMREAILAAAQVVAVKKRGEVEEKRRKLAKELETLRGVVLVTDEFTIRNKMTRADLETQLEVYRKVIKDPSVPLKTHIPNKPEKVEALVAAVKRYME